MNNIEQFSLYTAKIFEELYDAFPIPIWIDKAKITSGCLLFDKNEELQDLKNKKDMAQLLVEFHNHEYTKKIKEKLPGIERAHSNLENEKNSEIWHQSAIFSSTLDFLISEELVRRPENGGCVLTAKAFSHLNKSFKNGAVNNEDSTYIKTIKSIFSSTADTAEKIGIGIAVKVIPSFLGIS